MGGVWLDIKGGARTCDPQIFSASTLLIRAIVESTIALLGCIYYLLDLCIHMLLEAPTDQLLSCDSMPTSCRD